MEVWFSSTVRLSPHLLRVVQLTRDCPVKALGDLRAASFGQMNLLKGDIIAVVAAADNGWWTGELVDDGRRMGSWGAVFPKTFVCLL